MAALSLGRHVLFLRTPFGLFCELPLTGWQRRPLSSRPWSHQWPSCSPKAAAYLGGTPQANLAVQIFSFVGEYSSNWVAIFSGLLLSGAPVLILYFALQRYVIEGFSGGPRAEIAGGRPWCSGNG